MIMSNRFPVCGVGESYLLPDLSNIHDNNDFVVRWASSTRRVDLVKFLIERGANVNADDGYLLRNEAFYGYVDIVKFLVERGADVNASKKSPMEPPALSVASKKGHLKIVQLLVDSGADVNGDEGMAVVWAAHNGHLDIVKFLVEHGWNKESMNGAMAWADWWKRLEVVEYLKTLS